MENNELSLKEIKFTSEYATRVLEDIERFINSNDIEIVNIIIMPLTPLTIGYRGILYYIS